MSTVEIDNQITSFRATVKLYLRRAREIENYLLKKPEEWGRFQSEFNSELNGVFRNIMNFEKLHLAKGEEDKVYKMKQLFISKFKEMFARGVYCEWSIRKPYGYAGDFKIIDDIYENSPVTSGFDRLFDNYFQMSAISVAVRNRKDDFKRILSDFIKSKEGQRTAIMNLASGPCREIRELLSENKDACKNVFFDCYDNDEHAIAYSKAALIDHPNICFKKENAIRIAFRKEISTLIDKKYDFIYSTGLFDYFSERVAVLVVSNLKKLLKPDGIMAIANVRDKYSNPSVHFMEWAGDWNLIYRDDDNFRKIFTDAGFKKKDIEIRYEQQGIIQYVIASNK